MSDEQKGGLTPPLLSARLPSLSLYQQQSEISRVGIRFPLRLVFAEDLAVFGLAVFFRIRETL